jgi:hypothetical protein
MVLNKTPEFDLYYVAYLKDDPAKEPIATSYSAPGVLAEAAHKTGRAKRRFRVEGDQQGGVRAVVRIFMKPSEGASSGSVRILPVKLHWKFSGTRDLILSKVKRVPKNLDDWNYEKTNMPVYLPSPCLPSIC